MLVVGSRRGLGAGLWREFRHRCWCEGGGGYKGGGGYWFGLATFFLDFEAIRELMFLF